MARSFFRATASLMLVLGMLGGCESTPQPDPLQVHIDDMDQRLGRVERVVSNQSLVELSQRIDVIEAQLRELRGNVEELQNQQATLGKQQRDLYADLDRRIGALEAAAKAAGGSLTGGGAGSSAVAAGGGASVGSVTAGAGGDQATYERAFDALKAADYNAAITQFKDFLRQYPQSSLADNGQYWLGEAYYVTRDYDAAAAAFRAVGEQYPQSRKAPDALLKLGYTQYEQKHVTEARDTLNQVIQRYPNSDAAKLAMERLPKMTAPAAP